MPGLGIVVAVIEGYETLDLIGKYSFSVAKDVYFGEVLTKGRAKGT